MAIDSEVHIHQCHQLPEDERGLESTIQPSQDSARFIFYGGVGMADEHGHKIKMTTSASEITGEWHGGGLDLHPMKLQ